jgi:tRNA pseudouridine32 synthase/23S rRNA pseudouridine746 synthase
MADTHFLSFNGPIDDYPLPEKFTFPFYYTPHPLCELASQQLQHYLQTQTDWQHDFGIGQEDEHAIGKMFGVLLVKNEHGDIGYLAGYSGKIANQNNLAFFVPPVFDMLQEKSFFQSDLAVITAISEQLNELEANEAIEQLTAKYQLLNSESEQKIALHRQKMIEGRKKRKIERAVAEKTLSSDELALVKDKLSRQSIKQKNQLRDMTYYWQEKLNHVLGPLNTLLAEIEQLKQQRKTLSQQLQNKLFDQYNFLNSSGIEKNLRQIFEQTVNKDPPAGAGECAAPKLLHYAFQNNMKPLAMAEFWWGASPKSEIRQHKKYYPACQGKCQPILAHMLAGIEIDNNPLLDNPAVTLTIDIIYQDDEMLIINKPSGLLSVPGKNIEDSVYFRMKMAYPNVDSPLIVHRLDMSTSGLMVIALTKKSHKKLQQQFINRTVEKRYIALLSGTLQTDEGDIDLPLRVDLDDRPRQLVCYQYGRHAETKWQVIERKNDTTRVYFYPKTGRTHQLRVHSAHINGLNMPIIGDDLYGTKANRLHLHAELLSLVHPVTKKTMTFQVEPDF